MLFDFVNFRREAAGAAQAAGSSLAAATAQTVQATARSLPIIGQAPVVGSFCCTNTKLGPGMATFDMTPIASCPGSKHAICTQLRPDGKTGKKPICWACRKRYRQKKNKARLARNLRFSKSEQFVAWANNAIDSKKAIRAVRLPGIGDLYSAEFVRKVRAVVQAHPNMRFWLYTRSWAVPEIWEEIKTLKAEPNLTVWLSWDSAMAKHHGPPPDRDFPWCWLAETDDDLPPEPVAIVWRNDAHSNGKPKRTEQHVLGGCLVCPHENGVTKTNCVTCGICWRPEKYRKAKIAALLEKHGEPAQE